MGKLGRHRTFLVAPKDVSKRGFVTDLAGVATVNYNPQASIGNAVGSAAFQISNQIRTLGPVGSKGPQTPTS